MRRYSFICPKAEWNGHHEQTPGLRLYWTMRSLAQAYLAAAAACPGVKSGRSAMGLAIVPDMHTVDYRPVAQRVLISACRCCPPDDSPTLAAHDLDFERLPDTPDGDQRWSWTCHRPGCDMTGLHDAERWAIEAAMLHVAATDHTALERSLS
ncbi:hypothetical protein ABZ883_04880 [Streptomyces sp. NPDC046977]|uniref:hypothetical protein n=1 Tax=Streptomyces sp. NPDC046977 TaxID=3154703 RepID=UPI00340ED9AB